MASSTSSGQLNREEDFFGEMLFQGEKIGSSVSPKLYDVFINHRGPDVKQTLALELYNSLEKVGIRAFLDCKEMELGYLFPSTIQSAIYSASVQIAVFSPRYAKSVWCLAELALMLRTKKKIIPIFYDVPPSHLRFVEKGVYADSFNSHTEKRRYLDKLDGWKEALRCVSYISGYEFNHNNDNLETLCKNIVSAVRREVEKTRSLEIARYPIGIEELVIDFERTCWQKMEKKDRVIGVYGMGGSGKTTLVKELFNQKRSEFVASCFLFDVREAKLTSLQRKLLKDLVQEDRKFYSIPEGCSYLRSHLLRSPFVSFLIVIDDIDHVDQLNALLVRDLLLNNSRNLIIVTTRDERVLIRAGITSCYKMKEMIVHHSTELFCWHAFHQPYPTSGYEDLVESFVNVCGGLPLSLQVLGGHVFGSASKRYWKLELDKMSKTLPHDIKQRLRISFDSLEAEQKQVFMDVACFFVNKSCHMALRICEASGWRAEHTLQILMDKCLVEVQVGRTYWNGFDSESIPLLRMHDHIRDLGREIADELSSPSRLWCCQHLRSQEEKGFENILAGINGRSFRCLNSIFDHHTALQLRYFLGNLNDCEDASTSLLWLELDLSMLEKLDEHENIDGEVMSSVPSSLTIPSWVPLQSLQYLKISNGCSRRLWWSDQQAPLQLKELVLDGTNLEEFPDSLGMLIHLENLVLAGRAEWNGTEWNNSMRIQGRFFSESLRKLSNLRSLVLRDFTLSGELSFNNSMGSTTIGFSMVNLEKIDIRDVKHISKVSISGQHLVSLKFLHLESLESLIEVDLGLADTQNYQEDANVNTEGRSMIEELPSSARQCCLDTITIDGCWKLQKIKGIEELRGLKYLHLSAGALPIRGCLKMGQRLPSQVTSLIWESTGSSLQQLNMVSSFIGLDGTITVIPSKPEAELVVPVTEQTSAIIILMSIESFHKGNDCRKSIKIPPMHWMMAYIGRGKYIVAVIVTDKEKIIKMRYGMSSWIPMVSDHRQRTLGFIVTIEKRGEWRALPLLQHLCSQVESAVTFWPWEEVNGLEEICPAIWHFCSISEQHCTFRFRYFIEHSKDSTNSSTLLLCLEVSFELGHKLDELENLVRQVMTRLSSSLTVPPSIQLQSLQYLKISGGGFRRLWPSDERAALQLKELVLDGINLEEEFPNSLEMLSHLENLVIAGKRWKNCIRIDGRSFSKSLRKLTNLRSLVLRHLILSTELSFKDSMESTTLGSPMVSLEKVDIRHVQLLSKVSISGPYLRSLKSLHLEYLEILVEVDLGLAGSQNYLKDAKSNTEGCFEREEFPSCSRQCYLETITVVRCRKLQKIKGIEELQGLKYLHLSDDTVCRWSSTDMWQRIPSQVSTIIWKSCVYTESILQQFNVFSALIGQDGTVTKIPSNPEAVLVVPVTEQTSAIVIFMLLGWIDNSVRGWPSDWIEFMGIPPMDWTRRRNVVAVVVREKEKMNKMRDWIPSVSRDRVQVGCIVTFEKREGESHVSLESFVVRFFKNCKDFLTE